MAETREGSLKRFGEEIVEVLILDNGENFDPEEKGSIPNYDKIQIEYKNNK